MQKALYMCLWCYWNGLKRLNTVGAQWVLVSVLTHIFCKSHVLFPSSYILLCPTGMFRVVFFFSTLKFSLSIILEFLIFLSPFQFVCHFPSWKWNLVLKNTSMLFSCSVVDLLILNWPKCCGQMCSAFSLPEPCTSSSHS